MLNYFFTLFFLSQVMRCGGSCSHTFHNCIPDQTSVLTVPVLLSRRFSVAGPADTLCASVPVEQHESCGCGCDLGPTACNKRQFFLPTECRCTCSDSAARDACLARSWFWHPQLCQCMCPNRPYAPCPTGYIFDHVETCACRTLAYRAFSVLELVVVVVALGTLCTTLSLIQCYRKGLGLFKHRREIRYRTESFRSRLKSLSERLDRSRRRTGGVDVTVAAVAAVSAASGEQEEFIQLRSLSPQDSSNSSPKRLPGVLQLTG